MNENIINKLRGILLIILWLSVKYDIDILVIFSGISFFGISLKFSKNKKTFISKFLLTIGAVLILYYTIAIFEISIIQKM
ncbi:hypothetical protein QUF55_05355 [Clostridiaceae bacterium HSG29]|nr:hypothetical protein [Clostridiaceae bacterium HSG29]